MSSAHEPKDATETTRAAQARVRASLPLDDPADFERARRGLIAEVDPLDIRDDRGASLWSSERYAFVAGDAPDTVNPSLWRQAKLNAAHGLFQVSERVFQVRGYDISNVTFVAGDEGWVVIDPLTRTETARAALGLVTEHLGARPVRAVVYTHSHLDHFGGVLGVLDLDAIAEGRAPIYAPEGFLEAAVSENVVAGNAMLRRGTYMYGALLPPGPRGHVDAGLGRTIPPGSSTLVAPTELVRETGTTVDLDGVRVEFQLTPGAEAPAEMNLFLPDDAALCMAENCTANLHNVYTPRGAQIRDALAWSKYIEEAIERYAARSDVVFASHHWPRWGRDEGAAYLAKQRDLYRFVHDQTMRLANHGHTMNEIAEMIELPASLHDEFFARDYYGTLNHNAKAVYQRYLGWYDGNPAHLHPHPPVEAGRRYVEFMGGPDALLARARRSFDDGDYRWVAEVVNHLVFADPDNEEARHLQADALEQLGYQAESGPWRSFYLTGAQELRREVPKLGANRTVDPGLAHSMTVEMLFEVAAVRLDGPRAEGRRLRLNVDVVDRDDARLVVLENCALHTEDRTDPDADATVRVTRNELEALLAGTRPVDAVEVDGRREALEELLSLLDGFELLFDIVTP